MIRILIRVAAALAGAAVGLIVVRVFIKNVSDSR